MVSDFVQYSQDSLSPQQAKVYAFVKDSFYASGSMPTLREICAEMGWSAVGSAQTVVEALIRKGFLRKDAQKSRGLALADSSPMRAVPIVGAAPAGSPIESYESHEGEAIVPSFIRGPVFAVRVKGDSMEGAGLHDGDIAIVKQTGRAENEEIIVAMISGEVTIKRLMKRDDEIWLKPENPKYRPQKIMDPSFRVLGRVIGLHRYFEK